MTLTVAAVPYFWFGTLQVTASANVFLLIQFVVSPLGDDDLKLNGDLHPKMHSQSINLVPSRTTLTNHTVEPGYLQSTHVEEKNYKENLEKEAFRLSFFYSAYLYIVVIITTY